MYQGVHVEWVTDGVGEEVELSSNIAEDDGRYERHGVVVGTEQSNAEKEMVETVIMSVALDACEIVRDEIFSDGGCFLPWCLSVDVRTCRTD